MANNGNNLYLPPHMRAGTGPRLTLYTPAECDLFLEQWSKGADIFIGAIDARDALAAHKVFMNLGEIGANLIHSTKDRLKTRIG